MSNQQINTGGPAFPVIGAPAAPEDHPGMTMTLLDYFAAKAMVALCTMNSTGAQTIRDDDHMANAAYNMAVAMLKAREAALKGGAA